MLQGSLMKAFTERTATPCLVVQVLSVSLSKVLTISDGLHSLVYCMTDCDVSDITSVSNPII